MLKLMFRSGRQGSLIRGGRFLTLKALLGKLVRKILEGRSFLFSSLRLQLFIRECKRDAALVSKVSAELNLPRMDGNTAASLFARDKTLYILAGGASVNLLSDGEWAEISAGVSIGINFWPIHDFVPDILTSESARSEHANVFLDERLRRREMLEHPPLVFSLRPRWPVNQKTLQNFPEPLEQRRFVYGRANLITRTKENLVGDLRRVVRAIGGHQVPETILPDNGSTVARMTFWGLRQGFLKIVWVGVDQDSGPYFWTDPTVADRYAPAARAVPRTTGSPHSTSSASNRPFSNDVFLPALHQAFEDASDTRIFLGNTRSTLRGQVPLHTWTTNQH